MANKIYEPEVIETVSYPDVVEEETTASTNFEGKVVASPATKVNESFPVKIVARETISEAINTRTKKILGDFTFGQVGALSIGVYENGVTGDIRLTPNGITARDINGNTTFSLDGSTGDAIFKGTIYAGSLVTGSVVIQGQGAFIVNDGTYDIILLGYQSGGF